MSISDRADREHDSTCDQGPHHPGPCHPEPVPAPKDQPLNHLSDERPPTREHITDPDVECWCGPTHVAVMGPSRTLTYTPFADLAHDLVRYRQAAGNPEVMSMLDNIRFAFDDLIDRVAIDMPAGADATLAARAIHDACQRCIFAVVHAEVP